MHHSFHLMLTCAVDTVLIIEPLANEIMQKAEVVNNLLRQNILSHLRENVLREDKLFCLDNFKIKSYHELI